MIRCFLIFTFVALATHEGQQSPPIFLAPPGSPVTVGDGSGRILLADINSDARIDLLTAHLQKRFIAIQTGDGRGRFTAAPGSPLSLNYTPGDIKLGDFNSDTFPDLAVTSGERDEVDIFFNDGKGRFARAPGSPFTVSASNEFYTRSLFLADFNEDGKLDLATMNHRTNLISILFGTGRGTFNAAPQVKCAPDRPSSSFAAGDLFADLDGDSHLDLLVTRDDVNSEGGRVSWLRGDGKGAFQEVSGMAFDLQARPRFVRLADINGDRRVDLVMTQSEGRVAAFLNSGNGKFTPFSGTPWQTVDDAFAIAVSDVDGDGRGDFVIATVNSVTVLLNQPTGLVPASGSPFRAGPGSYHLAIGDINSDGKPDIAASSFEGKAVTLLLGM